MVSCGQALSPQRVRIVDADGTLQPDGQAGEIWVCGPHISQGYWRNNLATGDTFDAVCAGGSGDRFLRTGDLGFLRDGELFVTGRQKDIVIVRGVKHHGNDLDDTITSVSPDLVAGAGAVFVDEDGPQTEQQIIAVYELSRRTFTKVNQPLLARAVKEAVTRAHGITLDRVIFVREGRLPRTTSGKVQRHLCRAFAFDDGRSDD